ncbi:unnamed protein product [Sphagnum jensenii]
MRDPVTVCTGITYDRRPIQKWLAEGHTTCPTTMCHLENHILIPNLIVRRLIQSWVQENGSGSLPASAFGSPKRDTEKQRSGDCTHAEPERVLSLLREIARGGQGVRNAAKCLGALAKERVEYRTCIDELGGTLLLVSLLSPEMHEDCEACEEVLGALVMLAQCRGGTRQMVMEPQTLACVVWHLDRGTPCARVNAAALLESLLASDELCASVGRFPGVLQGLVKLVNEGGGVQQHRASKIAVRTLLAACLCKVNRPWAADAGAVRALVEHLTNAHPSTAERCLAIFELLCTTTEGQVAVSRHPLAIPLLVKMVLRVSPRGTEYATGTLLAICKSGPIDVLQVAMQAGAQTQMLFLLQSDGTCTPRAKRKALELLKLLHTVCCLPTVGKLVNAIHSWEQPRG